jgi:Flavodoxin
VIDMRALVVYESMYGNTHVIASNIADGLSASCEVTLVPVAEATWDLVADADLLVAGAPTHMHGLSSRSTRRMAAQAAAKDGSGLRMDLAASGPGMRDWLRDLGHRNGLAATFDTRISGVPAFTGRASRPIARLLRQRDRRLVAAPESFLVGSQNTLLDGEAGRARRWGMTLGAVSKTYLPAPA